MVGTSSAAGAAIEVSANDNRRPLIAFVSRAGLGIAFLAIFLWLYGVRRIGQSLASEQPGFFIAAIALYLAGQVMSAYRWQLLARVNGIGGAFREYLAYYFIGMFTNLFIPGLIGGDAARSTYLGLHHRRIGEALGSVVADRGIGLVALFWLAAAAALIVSSVPIPARLVEVVVAIGVLTFIGFFAAPLIAVQVSDRDGKIDRFARPLIAYLRNPFRLAAPLLLSLILQASLAVCQYLLALGMGLEVPLSAMLLVVPMANLAASLPLTLNGLGVREGAYLLLFGMVGVSHQDAIALGLLWFSCTMLGGVTGVVPFVLTRVPRAKT